MVILLTGASHTGKTLLAQRLLEKYRYPYLSLDHLKMGLIRSGHTKLTPLSSDADLTAFLWPIAREMIKTAIENRQNLIVELVLSERYIRAHFDDIKRYANVIEARLCDECSLEQVLADNAHYQAQAQAHGIKCILIDDAYEIDLDVL